MLHRGEDQDLKDLFRDLRKEEQDGIPAFRTMMARAEEEAARSGLEIRSARPTLRPATRALAWSGSLLAAAAAAAIILLPSRGTSEAEFVQVVQMFSSNPASGAWKSPTDALLELPGHEVLSTIPSIGSLPWLPDSNPNHRRNES